MRLSRIVLLCLATVLLAGGGWAWRYGDAWLDRTVRARITEAVNRACVPGYHLHMDSVGTRAVDGTLVITGVDLGFDSSLVDSLRSGRFRYLFTAHMDRLVLRGLAYWPLLWRGEVKVKALELDEPEMVYIIGQHAVALHQAFQRLQQGNGGGAQVVAADTLIVHRARATVLDLGGTLPKMRLSGLDIAATGVKLSSAHRARALLSVVEAEIDVDSLDTRLADAAQVHIGRMHLSRTTRTGSINDLRLTPAPEELDTTRTDLPRSTAVALSLGTVMLNGINVDLLLAEHALHIRSVELRTVKLDATLDKDRPLGPRSYMPLPVAAFLAVPFPIAIDTVLVADGEVLYRERSDQTLRWGTIPITHLHARFTHVTNEPHAPDDITPLLGEISCLLYDSARISATYSARLDASNTFTFTADITDLPFPSLNAATLPLLRMQVKSGNLQHLVMTMNGNDARAKGSLAMDYTDLSAQVDPDAPADLRHSMFGDVLKTMLSNTYGGGLSDQRKRTYTVERATERSLLTYIWHFTREGLMRNLMPSAVERMRSMIRQDKQARRDQRQLRKARKKSAR